MPFRLWPKRSKHEKLERRVRHLEKTKNHYVTGPQVLGFWKNIVARYGLLTNVEDVEKLEAVVEKMAKDVAIIKGKLNELLPLDDGGEDDAEDAKSERSVATRNSDASHGIFGHNNVGPHAVASKVSPEELPMTFTRRKSDCADRATLDATSLRLAQRSQDSRKHRNSITTFVRGTQKLA